ncbi:MAG: Rv3654c family TadE-like protein [Rhodoluna sp.]
MKQRSWGDRGSGTILALAVVMLSVACLGVVEVIAGNFLRQARLASVADSAALAADDALRGLTTGFPCDIAKAIARENMANLDECRIVGFEAFVNLQVQGIGIVLNASARAGPSN